MYLARLLASSPKHRLLSHHLPSSSSFAATFSTASSPAKRPNTRRPKQPPPEISLKPEKEEETLEFPPEAAGRGGWEREKLPSELRRPPTIPFQPRVANAVRLVGTIGAPVQLQWLPEGRLTAVSVLVQDKRSNFPKFWIPIIFQDDLAQIAASHLQENDLVYVSGQLNGDVPPFKLSDGQANIQVVVHLLSYVDNESAQMDIHMVAEEKEVMEAEKEVEEAEKEVVVAEKKKLNYKSPGTVSGYKNKDDKLNKLWSDVVASPEEWTDNRADKQNGSKSPKYPDFKNKVSKEPLWLNTAPTWVLEKLDDLVFGGGYSAAKKKYAPIEKGTQKGKYLSGMKFTEGRDASAASKQKLEADLWKNLVDNPKKWWDNRLDKFKNSFPDFKHKDTGEALWISPKTPKWVLEALPPVASEKGTRKRDTLLS